MAEEKSFLYKNLKQWIFYVLFPSTVLIVDDNVRALSFFEKQLKKKVKNFHFHYEDTPLNAIKILRQHPQHPLDCLYNYKIDILNLSETSIFESIKVFLMDAQRYRHISCIISDSTYGCYARP